MIVLDENIRADQAELLRRARLRHRCIGKDIAPIGTSDENIIPVLHRLKRPTLFSHDKGFFDFRLCHPSYCLVWLDVKATLAAVMIQRFLRHSRFNPQSARMGSVAAVHYHFVEYWQPHARQSEVVPWDVSFREIRHT